MKFATGTRVSPSTNYYSSSSTHAVGIPGYSRALELRELAVSLGKDKLSDDAYAQRVHEYVYNNVRTTFLFGLQKGALGALFDQAGTPFDQANLMVELLREKQIAANYQIGNVTLDPSQISSWTGITSAVSACRLFVDGGFPATVNNSSSSSCSVSGNVASVQIRHIWVSALGKLWDPSFKFHTTKTGINLATATQCGTNTSCSGSLTAAATAARDEAMFGASQSAMPGSTNSVLSVNKSRLETKLGEWAINLKNRINLDVPSASIDDVIGARMINAAAMPVPGEFLTYGTPASVATHSEIPDPYRTTIRVVYDSLDRTLFVDEIYGRRLRMQILVYGNIYNQLGLRERWSGLYLESALLSEGYKTDMPMYYTPGTDFLTIHVNHPYASASGAYMDDSFVAGEILAPLFGEWPLNQDGSGPELIGGFSTAIVHAWGSAGRGSIPVFADLQRREVFGEGEQLNICPSGQTYPINSNDAQVRGLSQPWAGTSSGCVESERFVEAAQFFAQASRASDLVDSVNNSITTVHRSIGTVAWNGSLNVESGVSITSRTNSTSDRRSAIYSYALLSSRLEGGISEQMSGAWEGQSSAGAITRSNENSIRLARFNSASSYTNTSGMASSFPEINSAALAYLNAGFSLITPQTKTPFGSVPVRKWNPDPQLPFPRYPGTTFPFYQPSGLIAVRPSAADSTVPDRIAMLMQGLGQNQVIKGGGANIAADDPLEAALQNTKPQDLSAKQKKYFEIDKSAAVMRLKPAADLSTGGKFPIGLDFQRFYNSGVDALPHAFTLKRSILDSMASPLMEEPGNGPPEFNAALIGEINGSMIGDGWDHNWHITATIGSDAFQGLGEDSPIDAVAAITAIHTIRALTSSNPTFPQLVAATYASNWFGTQLNSNVVTVRKPPSSMVFVKLPDGNFNGPPNSGDTLTQAGQPSGYFGKQPDRTAPEVPVVRDYSGVTFTLTESTGSQLRFDLGSSDTHPGDILGQRMFKAVQWRFATGIVIDLQYAIGSQPQCLTRVSSNLGRVLHFVNETPSYNSLENGPINPPPYQQCYLKSVRDENSRTVSIQRPGASNIYGDQGNGAYFGALLRMPELRVTGPDGGATRYVYSEKLDPATSARLGRRITSIFMPGESTAFKTYAYDDLNRLESVTDALGERTDVLVGGFGQENLRRGTQVNVVGGTTITEDGFYDRTGSEIQTIDALGRVTSRVFDGRGRVVRAIAPELNETRYKYDLRSNQTEERLVGKPGSGLADAFNTTTYPATCANPVTCNLPTSYTDERTNVTNYVWDPTTGLLESITRPLAPLGAGSHSPRTTLCYTPHSTPSGNLTLLTGVIERVTDTRTRVISFGYDSANKFALAVTIGDPQQTLIAPPGGGLTCQTALKSDALNLLTTLTVDPVGNVMRVNGPRDDVTDARDVTDYRFDLARRLTRIDAPLSAISRLTYDGIGQLRTLRQAKVPNPVDSNPANPAPVDLVAAEWSTEQREYWPTGELKSVLDADGNLTQNTYDALGRRTIETDPDGRRSGTVYDAAGQVSCVWKGWNSASAPTNCSWDPATYVAQGSNGPLRYAAYGYSPNGERASEQDSRNNRTDFVYDGFDRLAFSLFPDPSTGSRCTVAAPVTPASVPNCPGGSSQTFEKSGYDAAGNRLTLQTRRGDTLTWTYDSLNRERTKAVTGAPTQSLVTFGYNLKDERTSVTSPAVSGGAPAHSVTYDYDDLGRRQYEENLLNGVNRRVTYEFDRAGNRSRVTWPDNYFVHYSYDALDRLQYVRENSTTSNELAWYQFDELGRRREVRFAGTATNRMTYTYEPDHRIDLLTNIMNGTTVSLDHGYSGAGRITSIVASDAFYLPSGTVGVTPYVSDALNRYSTIGTDPSPTYDLGGNLLSWGPTATRRTYTFDSENRLRSAVTVGGATAQYDYDALGRRVSKVVGATPTYYLLDGDEEIAEYSAAGAVLRRYITASAIDERIAMADGATTSSPTKTYYHVNHQGSVIAMTDSAGNAVGCATDVKCQRLSYDAFGNLGPGSTTDGQVFRYTGRRFDEESGLYYYRARHYSPFLGRFLQVDPIGTRDDLNLYAYAFNDPANKTDPMGKNAQDCILEAHMNPRWSGELSADCVEMRKEIEEAKRKREEEKKKGTWTEDKEFEFQAVVNEIEAAIRLMFMPKYVDETGKVQKAGKKSNEEFAKGLDEDASEEERESYAVWAENQRKKFDALGNDVQGKNNKKMVEYRATSCVYLRLWNEAQRHAVSEGACSKY